MITRWTAPSSSRNSSAQWIDFVAGNHQTGDNVLFCDGHVEYHRWRNPNTLGLPYGRAGFGTWDHNNEDLVQLWNWFDPKRAVPLLK